MADVTMLIGQAFPVSAIFKDAAGNDTENHAAPSWSVSNTSILGLDYTDPATVRVVAKTLGSASVNVYAGALQDQTPLTVDVVPGAAVSVEVVAGAVGT